MTVEQIINYVKWNAQLSSAGQPTKRQLARLAEAGFTVVINLAMPDTNRALVSEDFIVTHQDIQYVHIPVVWTQPTYRNLMHFFAMMDLYASESVLVHCIMNMRATVFVFLYLTLRKGIPKPDAYSIMAKVWQLDAVWQAFIDASVKQYEEDNKYG